MGLYPTKSVDITILAEDFEDNSYMNLATTEKGCPIQRAFIRQGIIKSGESYQNAMPILNGLDSKVFKIFLGEAPIETFTMSVDIYA